MSVSRAFTYYLPYGLFYGMQQLGNLAIQTATTVNFSAAYNPWYMGPDESLGYVIAYTATTQPVPGGGTAEVQFWRSKDETDNSFIDLANYITIKTKNYQNFTTVIDAQNWLYANYYWTSYFPCLLFGKFNNQVYSISVAPNKNIAVGGKFSQYDYIDSQNFAYLTYVGTNDIPQSYSFFDGEVFAVKVQSDGKIICGGNFTQYSGLTAPKLIRLNPNLSIDTSFEYGGLTGGNVNTIAIQTDGKIVVGGDFEDFSGITAQRLLRLNTDGTWDNTFDTLSGANASIYSIKLQTDGKIVAVGNFTEYSGISLSRAMRINTDGTPDLTFDTSTYGGFNGLVRDLEIQSDGKIIFVGDFNYYNGNERERIVRTYDDATLDGDFGSGGLGGGFSFGFNTTEVKTVKLQTDGKILVGGAFDTYQSTTYNYFIRLLSDGSKDNTFESGNGFNSTVNVIELEPDGKILVGGNFSSYSGTGGVDYFVRLDANCYICGL